MRFELPKIKLTKNLPESLRRCGYFSISSRFTGQSSFVRRLSGTQRYPRYHLYVDDLAENFRFNLHLDQKEQSYKGSTAHSGDYDEPAVEQEKQRIISLII